MAITTANEMDTLIWSQVSDQFGLTSPDAETGYTDLNIRTIDGVTYVASTQYNGDVDLWTYDSAMQSLTLLASHEGSNPFVTSYVGDLRDPEIMSIDGKIVLVGGDEHDNLIAFTYDPALGPSTVDNDNRLVETQIDADTYNFGGINISATHQFAAANGQTYVISQGEDGGYDGGTLSFDGAGNLVFNQMVASSTNFAFNTGLTTDGNVLVDEYVTTTGTANTAEVFVNTVSYHQVGDVVYEYVGSNHGSSEGDGTFHVVKWEVDGAGQLTGSQVIYADGTTTKDLIDNGYTQPFPATSPFDGTSATLSDGSGTSNSFFQAITGLANDDTADNSVDAAAYNDIYSIKVFETGGKTYMFMATGASDLGQDAVSIFEVDPVTMMPTTLVDIVENEHSNNLDSDDALFSFDQGGTYFRDVQVMEVNASGEIVIAATVDASIIYFKFDPALGFGSGDTVNTGALTYIGTEGNRLNDAYNLDTDGANQLGANNGENTSFLQGFEILPDGNILVANNDSIWLAEAGVTDLTAPNRIVEGTAGNDLIDGTYVGDPDGDLVDNNDG